MCLDSRLAGQPPLICGCAQGPRLVMPGWPRPRDVRTGTPEPPEGQDVNVDFTLVVGAKKLREITRLIGQREGRDRQGERGRREVQAWPDFIDAVGKLAIDMHIEQARPVATADNSQILPSVCSRSAPALAQPRGPFLFLVGCRREILKRPVQSGAGRRRIYTSTRTRPPR